MFWLIIQLVVIPSWPSQTAWSIETEWQALIMAVTHTCDRRVWSRLQLPGGRRGLAESKSCLFEPGQNTAHVAGLSTTACQARHGNHASLDVHCTDPGDSPWFGRSDWQPSVVVWPRRHSLSKPAQSLPRSTKCNNPPINSQCTNFVLFIVAL